jgi:HEAT repeat protein
MKRHSITSTAQLPFAIERPPSIRNRRRRAPAWARTAAMLCLLSAVPAASVAQNEKAAKETAPPQAAEAPPDEAADKPAASVWTDSLGRGLTLAQRNARPILVRAGGAACPYCRVMEKELAKPEARKELQRWTLVSIDVDKSPAEARQLTVSAIPAFRILTPAGKVVAEEEGAMPAADFVAWLKENFERASTVPPAELTETGEPSTEAVGKLLREFRNRDATIREAAIRRLLPYPDVAARPVVAAFSEGSLASQLSALELLREWQAPLADLDPWQPQSLTGERLKSLSEWAATVSRPEAAVKDHLTDEELSEARGLLDRLLAAPPGETVPLRERLARFGRLLLPEVYERLKTAAGDESRERLSALRYRLVASEALVLEWSGGIERLAASDAETRHRAADELARRATPAEEPLLLELFSDSSPLVRELSLRALRSVGGENANSALLRLLDDPEPNVRAAVLKQLAEESNPAVAPRVAPYALAEQDGDLVVHAIRVLRESPGQAAIDALTKLLLHQNWQVRAEAAEGLGKIAASRSQRPGSSDAADSVRADIYVAMIGLLKDPDGFVVSRAVGVLAKADLLTAVDPLAETVQSHPELASEIVKSMVYGNKTRARSLAHLHKFITNADPRVRAAAISGLCRMDPEAAEADLRTTLADADSEVRIAAATGLFGIIQTERRVGVASYDADEEPVPDSPPPTGFFQSVIRLFSGASAQPAPPPMPESESNKTESDAPAEVETPAGTTAPAVRSEEAASIYPEPGDPAEAFLKEIRAGKGLPMWQHNLAPLLEPLVAAASPRERLAGALALLALGRDSTAITVLDDLLQHEQQMASQIAGALPWLPVAERERMLAKLLAAADLPLGALPTIAEILAAIRSPHSGDALWKLSADARIDPEAAEHVRDALAQYYLGQSYQYNMERVAARRRKAAIAAAGLHATSGAPWERLIALSLLLSVGHDDAAEKARLLLDDETAESEFRADALQALLLALSESRADELAAQQLASKRPKVRERALEYLTLGNQEMSTVREGRFTLKINHSYSMRSRETGQPIVPEAPEGLAVDDLLPLLDSGDPRTAALAGYLLALLDRDEGLPPLLRYWEEHARDNPDWMRLVYRAIARGDDSSRVGVLNDIYGRLHTDDHSHFLPEFYWTIRSMTGPEILELRKTMRDEVGVENLR